MFFRHLKNLALEFLGFARENKAWWIVPMMIILGLIALVVAVTHGVAPFLYTFF